MVRAEISLIEALAALGLEVREFAEVRWILRLHGMSKCHSRSAVISKASSPTMRAVSR